MRRLVLGPLAVLVAAVGLLVAPSLRAADLPYEGTWKITILDGTSEINLWLVKISKDGKKIDTVSGIGIWKATKFSDVKADDKALRCTLMTPRGPMSLSVYAGKDKTMRGSIRLNLSNFVRARLDKTEDTEIDAKAAVKNQAGAADFKAAVETKDVEDKIKALQDILKDHEGKPITYLTSQILVGELVRKKAGLDEFKEPTKVYVAQAKEYGHEITVGAHLTLAKMFLNYDKTEALALNNVKTASQMLQEQDRPGLQLDVYMTLIQALEKNKKEDEIKPILAKINKTAEAAMKTARDDAMKLGTAQTLARVLLGSPNKQVADIGLEYARKTVEFAKEDKLVARRLGAYQLLHQGLTKQGKTEEAARLAETIEKLEGELDREFAKSNIPFAPDKFTGRKGKSNRVVLVELFTGAQCPPCVSADIAFDAAERTYSPREAVFLQYHLHIPRADPLTNAATEARSKFYGDDIEGTPTMFVDGKVTSPMGGAKMHAQDRYEKLRELIDKNLEEKEEGSLKVEAKRAGDKIDITADVSGLKEAGEKIKLRFVLVEDVVRYLGVNGQRLHHHVVRDFPGGVDGIKLEKKEGKHTASVDVADVRKKLAKYLTNYAAKNPGNPFFNPSRPLALRKLKVVAFVQNDDSKKVLQAAQVDVPEAKGGKPAAKDDKKDEKKDKEEKKDDK